MGHLHPPIGQVRPGRLARFFGDLRLRSRALHQFDAIAEGIENVGAAQVADGRVRFCGEPGAFARRNCFIEIVDDERGMRALGGVKIGGGFDAEMEIHWASCEPDAVTSGHRRGLLLLGETENADVKRARGFFTAGGNRHLHVIEAKDWHRVMKEAARRLPKARRRSSCRAIPRRETSGLRAGRERECEICSGAWISVG